MTAQELWERFVSEKELENVPYEAWAFGDSPDELARLVDAGIKTGTSSAFALYELAGEDIPKAGDYSVILNESGEAVCIVRNRAVTVLPYQEVTATHAYQEGEGDRTLAYWRRVHERFFRDELTAVGLAFSEDMLVVYEEFEKIYP